MASVPLKRLDGIEICRGLAAMLVVLYHASRHIDKALGMHFIRQIFQFGHSGVDLFFVISGFIIFYIHGQDIGKKDKLFSYVKKRFIRIMPLYWIAMLITFIIAVLGKHQLPVAIQFLWQFFLLPANGGMILDVAWTLKFEVLFYMLFAILITNKLAGTLLLAAWYGIAILSLTFSNYVIDIPHQFYDAYVLEFMFGIMAAIIIKEYKKHIPDYAIYVGIMFFMTSAILEDLNIIDGYKNAARLMYGISSMMIIMSVASFKQNIQKNIFSKFLFVLGDATYSVYLFQFILIGITWKFLSIGSIGRELDPGVQFVIISAIAIFGGIWISFLIEKPTIIFTKKILDNLINKNNSTKNYCSR